MSDDVFASVRGPMMARPFPLAPLFEVTHCTSIRSLAFALGLDTASVSRAVTAGLTWRQADTWACRLGRHPSEVWGQLWFADCDPDPELDDGLEVAS